MGLFGDKPGTLLLDLQPEGTFVEFFMKSCKMTKPPTPEEAEQLFAAHGMKVLGPPSPCELTYLVKGAAGVFFTAGHTIH